MIRVTYEKDPGFPATDQHPDCLRATIGKIVVDYIGALPTQAELDAHMRPPATPKDSAEQFLDALRANPGKLAAIRAQLGI